MIDDDDEAPWQTCPVCRTRPASTRMTARELQRHLPRGWRPLATQRPVGAWAAEVPCCIECGTCWLLWHDPATELLEATAPLPDAVTPLLLPETALVDVLPLLREQARGSVPTWVRARIDELFVTWFEAAPLRAGTAARGLLHAAVAPEALARERATALRALRSVIRRAREGGETLDGDWVSLLADPRLRISGPAVIEALRAALDAGLAPPPVLRCPHELQERLAALRARPRVAAPAARDLAARIRRAFHAR